MLGDVWAVHVIPSGLVMIFCVGDAFAVAMKSERRELHNTLYSMQRGGVACRTKFTPSSARYACVSVSATLTAALAPHTAYPTGATSNTHGLKVAPPSIE